MTGDSHGSRHQEAVPTELVARLEAASAGSRKLDGDVEVAVRDVFAARSGLKPEHWAKWRSNAAGAVGDGHTLYAAAPVTTSLDAALALAERVLDGQSVRIIRDPYGRGTARINGDHATLTDAATPALALCIAVLKATSANSVGTSEKAGDEA